MNSDQTAHWQKTNLDFDDSEWGHPKYTYTVIDRGHALVIRLCERLSREQGGSPDILDIGCGEAPFYDKLCHLNGTYIGVEPSAPLLQRVEPSATKYLIRGSGERLVIADSCIDIALNVSALDHCLDAEETSSSGPVASCTCIALGEPVCLPRPEPSE